MNWTQQLSLAFQLLSNAALLAVGTLVYCELHRRVEHRLPGWKQTLLYGSVFGIFVILTSLAPAITTAGFAVSLRVCAVVIATLYCGIAAGAVVCAFVVGFILVMEPSTGAVGQFLGIFASYVLAAVDRTLILPRGAHPRLLNLGMVALAVALIGFGAIALVRGRAGVEASFTIFGPAWIVILTVTIIALGGIIQHFERSRALAAAVADNERRFRSFYNETPTMLSVFDREGRCVAVSDLWLEVMGYRREEVIGRSRFDLLAPASGDYVRDRMLPALREGSGMREFEARLVRKDGTPLDVSSRSILRRDPVTGDEQVLSVVTDQTARKQAEAALTESRDLLLESQRLGKLGYILSDTVNDRVYWSDSLCEMRKVPQREFFTLEETRQFMPSADRAEYIRIRDAAATAHRDFEIDSRIQRGDGSIGWEHGIGHPRYDADGNCVGVLFVVQDVTASRLANEALRRSEADLRAIMDNAPFAIFLKDRERRYRLINRTYTDWFGDLPEDIHGKTTAEVYSNSIAEMGMRTDEDVLQSGAISVLERSATAKAGIEYVQTTKFPIRGDGGDIVGIAGFIADISARMRAEESLRESEERYRLLADNATDIITLRELGTERRLYVSPACRAFGYEPDEVAALAPGEGAHPDDLAHYMATRASLGPTHEFATATYRLCRKDGVYRWVENRMRFIAGGSSGPSLLVSTIRDITERRAAEDALRHSEERFRALIEYSNDLVTVIGRDGRVTYRSPSSAQVLGYAQEEVIGHLAFERIHPDDRDEFRAALKAIGADAGRQATGRFRVRHQDGSWRTLAWSARDASDVPGIDGIIVNSRDVTGALLLEEQLRESQKMEAVGQLAGGIAHDFNNILGAILGFAGFLLEDLPKGTAEHGFAERIMTASERGRDLVQQILAFSRRSAVERHPTDLVLLMRETRDLLRASIPSSARLEITAEAEGLVANVNAAQISQILLNLCLNAKDALHGEPGTIAISLDRIEAGDPDLMVLATGLGGRVDGDRHPGRTTVGALRAERDYARIAVTDTGAGMAPEVLDHIFDPFFTTKGRGHGTGLGLSVVHGIVMAYEGACVVTSHLGEGSAFTVYLPLTDTAAKIVTETAPRAPTLRGHERVLVVDDEVIMTDVLVIGLERLGYEAVALNDPKEAIKVFAEDPAAWDVVVSDQVMPGMNGLTLFKRLKEIRPTLHFILCTGFSEEATEERALEAGVDAFFMKPAPPEQLAVAIRRIFDNSAEAV